MTLVRQQVSTCSSKRSRFQVVLLKSLKPADLVTEIPLGQEEIFLSSPAERAVSLDALAFVDDDTVLLCGDSPAQLIEKNMGSHTRIYVDTARKFGLTLNFNKSKTEALVSWCRRGRSQVLSHVTLLQENAASTPCLGVQTCWYAGLGCSLTPA